jgi:hypothetical protein
MSALDIEKERETFIAFYSADYPDTGLPSENLTWDEFGFDDGVVQSYWCGWLARAKRAIQPVTCNDGGKCGAGGYCELCPHRQPAPIIPAQTGAVELPPLPLLPKAPCLLPGVYAYRESDMDAYGRGCYAKGRGDAVAEYVNSGVSKSAGTVSGGGGLRAALKPFADAFEQVKDGSTDADPDIQEFLDGNTATPKVTMGDFQRAHEAIAATGQGGQDAKLRELLREADDLLWVASGAMLKMGLRDRGSDCGLSHEVRMFALEFSKEGRDGPGALQVQGTGRYNKWLKAARNIDRAAIAAKEGK